MHRVFLLAIWIRCRHGCFFEGEEVGTATFSGIFCYLYVCVFVWLDVFCIYTSVFVWAHILCIYPLCISCLYWRHGIFWVICTYVLVHNKYAHSQAYLLSACIFWLGIFPVCMCVFLVQHISCLYVRFGYWYANNLLKMTMALTLSESHRYLISLI